jgi:hypothetical protein
MVIVAASSAAALTVWNAPDVMIGGEIVNVVVFVVVALAVAAALTTNCCREAERRLGHRIDRKHVRDREHVALLDRHNGRGRCWSERHGAGIATRPKSWTASGCSTGVVLVAGAGRVRLHVLRGVSVDLRNAAKARIPIRIGDILHVERSLRAEHGVFVGRGENRRAVVHRHGAEIEPLRGLREVRERSTFWPGVPTQFQTSL